MDMKLSQSRNIKPTAWCFRLLLWTILGAAVGGALLEIFFGPRLTADENSIQSSGWYKLVTAFSLKRNWNTLIQMDLNPDDISCVHGIRFIFSMTIYLLHRGVFGMFVPFSNRTEIAKVMIFLLLSVSPNQRRSHFYFYTFLGPGGRVDHGFPCFLEQC